MIQDNEQEMDSHTCFSLSAVRCVYVYFVLIQTRFRLEVESLYKLLCFELINYLTIRSCEHFFHCWLSVFVQGFKSAELVLMICSSYLVLLWLLVPPLVYLKCKLHLPIKQKSFRSTQTRAGTDSSTSCCFFSFSLVQKSARSVFHSRAVDH